MKTPEVVYFEGLPGSGKTSLTTRLAAAYPDVFEAIPEYVNPDRGKEASTQYEQEFFLRNDELKHKLARESGKISLVDRGHLSTVLYSRAYAQIRGDKDLSYVDDWYRDKILQEGMLPDRYVILDIDPKTSLDRRKRTLEWDNMWDHEEALAFARESYPAYMEKHEPGVPVLIVSSDKLSLPEMQKEVVIFLASEHNRQIQATQ